MFWSFVVTGRNQSNIFLIISKVVIKPKSVTSLNSEYTSDEVSILNLFFLISWREWYSDTRISWNILIPSILSTHLARYVSTSFWYCAFGTCALTFYVNMFFGALENCLWIAPIRSYPLLLEWMCGFHNACKELLDLL